MSKKKGTGTSKPISKIKKSSRTPETASVKKTINESSKPTSKKTTTTNSGGPRKK